VIARRLLLLLAVLLALTIVGSSIAPPPGPPGLRDAASPSPTPRAPAAAPKAVRATLSGASDRAARSVTARLGDQVQLVVTAPDIDAVALGDLDTAPVEPGLPARFDLLADERGRFPVVLLNAGRRVGTLVVR
jgi:hypothetical protein